MEWPVEGSGEPEPGDGTWDTGALSSRRQVHPKPVASARGPQWVEYVRWKQEGPHGSSLPATYLGIGVSHARLWSLQGQRFGIQGRMSPPGDTLRCPGPSGLLVPRGRQTRGRPAASQGSLMEPTGGGRSGGAEHREAEKAPMVDMCASLAFFS